MSFVSNSLICSFLEELMFRLIIVFTNFILNHFENNLNKVTLAIHFKDIYNFYYPRCRIKVIFLECLYRYLSLSAKGKHCKCLNICVSILMLKVNWPTLTRTLMSFAFLLTPKICLKIPK